MTPQHGVARITAPPLLLFLSTLGRQMNPRLRGHLPHTFAGEAPAQNLAPGGQGFSPDKKPYWKEGASAPEETLRTRRP